jgi:gliding motility-associated-like protein
VQEFTLHSSIDTIYKTLAAGSYTAAVTTSGGCVINEGPIVVNPTVTPGVTINASATEICSNATVSFTAVPVNGGPAPGYQWLVNGVDAGGNSSSFVTSALSGDAQVICVMTGNAICTSASVVNSNVVAVQVDPLVTPAVSINASADNICAGTTVSFTATPLNGGAAPGYQWLVNGVDAGSNSASFNSSSLTDGSVVSCTLAGSALCATAGTAQSNVITIAVNAVVVPVVAVTPSADPICAGVEVNFVAAANGASDFHYQWQVNDVNVGVDSSGYSTAGLKNGDVVVCTVSSGAVCVTPEGDSVAMTVNPIPVIMPDQVFADQNGAGVTVEPKVTGDIASYEWTPATGLSADNIADPIATPAATTVYTLSVVSTDGCKASGEITVKVFTEVRIPNAFTPNGDGHNDIFYVLGGPEGSAIKDFSVFDRWGQRVFRVEGAAPGDPTYGWNGTIKGSPAPAGAYVYILALAIGGGPEQVYKGTVMLIR